MATPQRADPLSLVVSRPASMRAGRMRELSQRACRTIAEAGPSMLSDKSDPTPGGLARHEAPRSKPIMPIRLRRNRYEGSRISFGFSEETFCRCSACLF